MAGIFTTLHLEIERTGEQMPVTCIGQDNLIFRINEAAAIPGVRITGVSSDAPLNEAIHTLVDDGATVTTT